ncbi:MAG: hypothetical protein ABSH40_06405 [Bryobacteraceae bacterium]|jgi:hypothetical protein
MRKLWLTLAALALAAWAANVRLYLKDGTYHMVREYQVQADRVRYYSVERSDWEEIPIDLVDLKRTESEAAERRAEVDKEAKASAEEDAAEKAARAEVSRIPQDPGVYWVENKATRVLKAGEVSVHTPKGRMVLQKLAYPFLSGKGTLELNGPHSLNVFTDPEQEFYIQLSEPEDFGIAKLTTKGGVRIVENLNYNAVIKDLVEEERTMVDILRREMAEGLYKIWPQEKLEPGEYAVVEFTDGKVNMQVFDFAIKGK